MENMSNIQKLAKQALKTFRTTSTAPSKQNLDVLKAMMDKVTAVDINLRDPAKDRRRNSLRAPPVSHVEILDCPYFTMAVFIVNNGRSIPLHGHPGMYGFCKVIYGSIQVKIYDKMDSDGYGRMNGALSNSNENEQQKVYFRGAFVFDATSNPCMVSPSHGSYHSITAVNGAAAFLDILGPPYDSDRERDCIYYKEQQVVNTGSENGESHMRYLVPVPCPEEFFCDSQPYKGPVVKLKDLIESWDGEQGE